MVTPDGWTPEREAAYQKYVAKKLQKSLSPRDRDGWQQAVDRWKHLKTLGDQFRDQIFAELGCQRERGYQVEVYRASKTLGARYKDIAALALKVSIEVKYGAVNSKAAIRQLGKDAAILRENRLWLTVWIVQDLSKIPAKVKAEQTRLQQEYPGRFLVIEASPAARERVTEQLREMLRERESRQAQQQIGELRLDLGDLHAERVRTPGFGIERERELTAQLAEANSQWMQIEQELTVVREQRAQREQALNVEVEREQFRRALETVPHEHELLRTQLQQVREAQLAEREAYARIWQTEFQGLARTEHAHALAACDAAEHSYRELEAEVRQRLSQVAIEPVNREHLQVRLEQVAHQDRVLTERTTTQLEVLEKHLTRHAEREREAASREYDVGARRQRENVAAALDRNQQRYMEMAKDFDRHAFLAWVQAGRDESRLRHFERDGNVLTEITRPGTEPMTVRYDSKERETEKQRREEDRTRQRHQEQQRGHERSR